MSKTKTCANCIFWLEEVVPQGTESRPLKFRYCRRYPPTVNISPPAETGGKKIANYYWPVISETDWCGEFRNRAAFAVDAKSDDKPTTTVN